MNDYNQIEDMLILAASAITEQSASDRLFERKGGRGRGFAPQGAFPCRAAVGW